MNGRFNLLEASALMLGELEHYMALGLVDDVGNHFTRSIVQKCSFEIQELQEKNQKNADRYEDELCEQKSLLSESIDREVVRGREVEELKKQLDDAMRVIGRMRTALKSIADNAKLAMMDELLIKMGVVNK